MAALAGDSNTQIVIRAAVGVSNEVIVSVMEQAKRVGLSRIAVATLGEK